MGESEAEGGGNAVCGSGSGQRMSADAGGGSTGRDEPGGADARVLPPHGIATAHVQWGLLTLLVVGIVGPLLVVAEFAPSILRLSWTTQAVMASTLLAVTTIQIVLTAWVRRRHLRRSVRAGWLGFKDSSAALTSLVAIGSLVLSTATLLITNNQNARQNELSLKAQISDRYAKSIVQLASEKADVRIGAVYSLRNIAQDDGDYKEQVVRTLAAFVVRNSMHKPCPVLERGSMLDTDAETALQAIGELPLVSIADLAQRRSFGAFVDDLFTRHGDANCWMGIRLARVVFRGYSFSAMDPTANPPDQGTSFDGAMLDDADFTAAWLSRASFRGASLNNVNFTGANLTESDLRSDVTNVRFTNADLVGANMCGLALNSYAGSVDLSGARMYGANLSGAHLEGTDLSKAFLHGVILDGASWDRTTTWPANFTPHGAPAPRGPQIDLASFERCQRTIWKPNPADEIASVDDYAPK